MSKKNIAPLKGLLCWRKKSLLQFEHLLEASGEIVNTQGNAERNQDIGLKQLETIHEKGGQLIHEEVHYYFKKCSSTKAISDDGSVLLEYDSPKCTYDHCICQESQIISEPELISSKEDQNVTIDDRISIEEGEIIVKVDDEILIQEDNFVVKGDDVTSKEEDLIPEIVSISPDLVTEHLNDKTNNKEVVIDKTISEEDVIVPDEDATFLSTSSNKQVNEEKRLNRSNSFKLIRATFKQGLSYLKRTNSNRLDSPPNKRIKSFQKRKLYAIENSSESIDCLVKQIDFSTTFDEGDEIAGGLEMTFATEDTQITSSPEGMRAEETLNVDNYGSEQAPPLPLTNVITCDTYSEPVVPHFNSIHNLISEHICSKNEPLILANKQSISPKEQLILSNDSPICIAFQKPPLTTFSLQSDLPNCMESNETPMHPPPQIVEVQDLSAEQQRQTIIIYPSSGELYKRHQSYFEWTFKKVLKTREAIFLVAFCHEKSDQDKEAFLYITPNYLAYSSTKTHILMPYDEVTDILLQTNSIHFTSKEHGQLELEHLPDPPTIYQFLSCFKHFHSVPESAEFKRNSSLVGRVRSSFKRTASFRNNKKSELFQELASQLQTLLQSAISKFSDKKEGVPLPKQLQKLDKIVNDSVKKAQERESDFGDTTSFADSGLASLDENLSLSSNNGTDCGDSFQESERRKVFLNTPVECVCKDHQGDKYLDETINMSIESLSQLMFATTPWYDQLEEFVEDDLDVKKFFGRMIDTVASDWKLKAKRSQEYTRTRNYNMTFQNEFLPCKVTVIENHSVLPIDNNFEKGLVVTKKVTNPGIFILDNHFIQITYCMTRVSETKTKLKIHAGGIFTKRPFMLTAKMVNVNTEANLREHYYGLRRMLHLISSDVEKLNNVENLIQSQKNYHTMPFHSFHPNQQRINVTATCSDLNFNTDTITPGDGLGNSSISTFADNSQLISSLDKIGQNFTTLTRLFSLLILM
uniref:VASt domain-containing protein n=1 Tax=Rhabditophanes sp. KR3021 TaxID=114890 RepID=A0AC35TI64_9BILA